jgi:hypothetical protein
MMGVRTLAVAMLLISSAWAGGGFFQRAIVTSMQTAECVSGRRSFAATMSGMPDTSRHENCAEYILVSPTTIFRVHASKSAPLLLPAEEVSFRPGKGALVLRRDDQQEDLEVKVVCMQLRNSKQDRCALADSPPNVAARNSH